MGELETLFEARLIDDDRQRRRTRERAVRTSRQSGGGAPRYHPLAEAISLRLVRLGTRLNDWAAPDSRRLIISAGPAKTTTEVVGDAHV